MEITAIVPSYNYGHMVGRAVDSALAQSYPLAEIIVVDDGSTDNTREALEHFGPPVRYLYQSNRGLSASRNLGLREARTPWVAFLDADDAWLPDKIRFQVKALEQKPGADMCYSGVRLTYESGAPDDIVRPNPPEIMWPSFRYYNHVIVSTVLARRELLLQAGGFNESLTACEDWDLWVRLGPKVVWALAPEPVTLYRVAQSSMSANVQKMVDNTERIMESTLLSGLSGWPRWVFRRRIRSMALFSGFVTARLNHQAGYRAWLWKSLLVWPSPFFIPLRHKTVVYELLVPNRSR